MDEISCHASRESKQFAIKTRTGYSRRNLAQQHVLLSEAIPRFARDGKESD